MLDAVAVFAADNLSLGARQCIGQLTRLPGQDPRGVNRKGDIF